MKVDKSGFITMSLSLMFTYPGIDEPSKPTPSVRTDSASCVGTVRPLSAPGRSTKWSIMWSECLMRDMLRFMFSLVLKSSPFNCVSSVFGV